MNQENKNEGNRQDQPRDHNFDGIQEYDNDLPRWWVYLFWITIVFAGCYLFWFHTPFGKGVSPEQEFQAEWTSSKKDAAAQQASQTAFDYLAAVKDAKIVADGKETYTQVCLPCHGPEGQGLVGPNLTDDFWIYGGTFASLEDVVSKGRAEKGMPAWEEILGKQKVQQVITFVTSIQGSHPANPKASQGDPGKLK